MLLLRGIALLAVAAATLSAAQEPTPTVAPTAAPTPTNAPTPAPAPTNPATTPTTTSATPTPTSEGDSSNDSGTSPIAATVKSVSDELTVQLSQDCESGRIEMSETELKVNCIGCTEFATAALKPQVSFVTASYTGTLNVDRLNYPALTQLQIASYEGTSPSVELLSSSFTSLALLSSLTFSRIDFTEQYLSLTVSPTLAYLKMDQTNVVDVSLAFQVEDAPLLTKIEFTSNRFDQLPLLLYERNYGRIVEVNSDLSFSKGLSDLSELEFANAKANLGATLDKSITFLDSCNTTATESAATRMVVCLNPARTGVRTIEDKRGTYVKSPSASGSSSSSSTGDTPSPTRSGSSTDTTLTIVVIVIAVVAAILAYFVARRYFCTSTSSSASPRHNERTVGLISKEESYAAHGKLSFISGDDTLRQIRLEQQDVSIGKSLGTGFLWSGDYQGRKVVIKRVEAESNDSRVTKALINQARGLVPVAHPNLAKLVGVTWIQGTDFGIVAEFMEKGTLKSVLMDLDTELDLQSKLHMCLDIAQALVYLHRPETNMYMKSLSSRKVLVNGAIECKLNLFECHPTTMSVEVPDVYGVGDMASWAPELVLHKPALDPRKMNIFSLGVLICEIVTRASPYQSVVDAKGHTLADIELTQKLRRQERLEPHENRREFTDLPAALRDMVERCLSYQPHQRPTADEVVQCLEAVKDYSERMGSTTSL